ncbi:MAG TPA: orotidine-5'-phosphate decarboxylase [Casimicrobiaceae bacterium]|nr:orotidine-5'-phosphate decarboxylase [Casimicrobiaceae bacterium]
MTASVAAPATTADPKVIVALDFADPAEAIALVRRLDPRDCALKVGKELFVAGGPEPVRQMIGQGFRVFLDLKFHDIPSTVAQACAAAVRLGVWMLNVHAAGGRYMLLAAREAVTSAAASDGAKPLLLAVTVLTSLRAGDLDEIGFAAAPEALALRLARLAQGCGLDGVVCSALEAPALRRALGAQAKLVTPGIRPQSGAADDQARVATPEAAIANGADYLVIGRPITQAADPRAALARINAALGVAR